MMILEASVAFKENLYRLNIYLLFTLLIASTNHSFQILLEFQYIVGESQGRVLLGFVPTLSPLHEFLS